jgi:hypothetical protein
LLTLTGVAVEKLVAPKFAKTKSRQDALQTTFSVFLDIFYPQNLAVWDEKGVFQQPQAITRFDRSSMSDMAILQQLRADSPVYGVISKTVP